MQTIASRLVLYAQERTISQIVFSTNCPRKKDIEQQMPKRLVFRRRLKMATLQLHCNTKMAFLNMKHAIILHKYFFLFILYACILHTCFVGAKPEPTFKRKRVLISFSYSCLPPAKSS